MLAVDGPAWARAGMLLVLAPLVEEAVFRAGLQEWLLRRGMPGWCANVSTAAAFGVVHLLAWQQWRALAVALPALVNGAIYGRWRRLRWCILAHAGMNAAWLAWGTMTGGTWT